MKPILILMFSIYLSNSCAQNARQPAGTTNLYASLKAVLVVGYSEEQTADNIRAMDKITEFLKEQGVQTYRFNDSAADWDRIKIAASGANFFLYAGHGSPGGGLNISSGGTTYDILQLQLSKNAVVGFQSVCYGAGSTASDTGEISHEEAVKRINWYAEPFLKAGAGCYFANNVNDGVLDFLRLLFSGQNSKSCFETLAGSYWGKVETVEKYVNDGTKEIGIASINWGGTTIKTSYINGVKTVREVPSHRSFDVAWVADPGFSIKDVLK